MFQGIAVFTFFLKLLYGALGDNCFVPYIENGNIKEQTFATRQLNWFTHRYQRPLQYKNLPTGSAPPENATLFLVCQYDHLVLGLKVPSIQVTCSDGKWPEDLVCFKNPSRVQIRRELGPSNHSTDRVSSVDDSLCFCEVTEMDESVVAYINETAINLHDRVHKGSAVEFRCEKVGFGRFIGKHEILCKDCQTWDTDEFPTCVKPGSGDAIILYDSNVNISMDGSLEVQEGQSLRLICIALEVEEFPLWSVPEQRGISEHQEVMENEKGTFYMSYLNVESISSSSDGFYVCIVGKQLPTSVKLRLKPTCSSKPPETENGRVGKMDNTHGGTVFYECLPGFKQVKTGNVNCNMGEWKGVPPICKDVRCYSESLKNLTGVAEIAKFTQDGDELKIRCSEGYEPRPNLPQCSVGEWIRSQESLCKEKDCTVPYILNGYVEELVLGPVKYNWWKYKWENEITKKTVQIGSVPSRAATLSLVCHNRFSVQGKGVSSARIMCSQGRWSPDPVCLKIRCYSESLKNLTGVAEIAKFTQDGDELKIRCSEGYEPRPNLPQCSVGEWIRSQESPCKEKDCTVPYILNGYVEELILGPEKYNWWKIRWERKITKKTVQIGSIPLRSVTLSLVCHKRFSVQGNGVSSARIVCSQGRWSPDPVCLITGSIYKPSSTVQSITANANSFTDWKSTTATVLSHSKSSGSNVQTQPLGTTAKSVPAVSPEISEVPVDSDDEESYSPTDNEEYEDTCSCEYLPDENMIAYVDGKEVKSHERVKNGTILKFRCEKIGYHRLLGPREIECKNCKPWSSSDFPSCLKPERGDTIILFENVSVSLDGVLEAQKGQSLKLTCTAMETAKFPKWRFPNVTEIKITEELRERTGDVLYLSHLDIKNVTSENNGPYECSVDDEVSTKLQVQIVDITCRQLKGSDLMTISYTDNQKIGSFASFHCLSPGIRSGVARTQCLENGEWQDSLPTCQSISGCLPLQKEPGSKLIIQPEKGSYKFGDSVTFLCQKELDLNIDVEKAMCLPGGWSVETLPECVKSGNNGSEEDF